MIFLSYCNLACFQCFHTTLGHVPTIEISAPSLLTARTTPVDTAATADLASMAMGNSVWQKVTSGFTTKFTASGRTEAKSLVNEHLRLHFMYS